MTAVIRAAYPSAGTLVRLTSRRRRGCQRRGQHGATRRKWHGETNGGLGISERLQREVPRRRVEPQRQPIGAAVSAHGSAASPSAERPAQYLRPYVRPPARSFETSDRRSVTPRRAIHTHTHHTHTRRMHTRVESAHERHPVVSRNDRVADRGRVTGCYLARASGSENSTFSVGESCRFSRRETLIFQWQRPSSPFDSSLGPTRYVDKRPRDPRRSPAERGTEDF